MRREDGIARVRQKIFHGERTITVKDLDLTMDILSQGTQRSLPSKERRGRTRRTDEAEN